VPGQLNSIYLGRLLALLLLSPLTVAAQEILNTMIIEGTLSNGSTSTIARKTGDLVVAINNSTGKEEGSADAETGTYGLIIGSKPNSFNGTLITLSLKRGTTLYELVTVAGTTAVVTYAGNGFFPTRKVVHLVTSSTIISGGPIVTTKPGTTTGTTTGTTPETTAGAPGDINGDGKISDVDIDLLKKAISGDIPANIGSMDINGDGVVNTRDLIDLIRAVRSGSRLNAVNLKK
jgi:hypothetical protein